MLNENEILFKESAKFILNEADKSVESSNKIQDKIITKLFKNLNNLTKNSDYKDIEVTKGDIQKLDKYSDLYNAELVINKVLQQQTRNDKLVEYMNILQNTRTTLINNRTDFMKGFQIGNKLVKYLYCNAVANYIISLGALISNGISIYKDEYNMIRTTLKTNIDIKTLDKIISPLRDFDSLVKNGYLNKLLKDLNKDKAVILESNSNILNEESKGVVDVIMMFFNKMSEWGSKAKTGFNDFSGKHPYITGGLKLSAIIVLVLWIISKMAYLWYSSMIRLSRYLEEISLLIEVSAQEQNNPEIKAKQEKYAKLFKKISDKVMIDSKVASNKAEELSKKNGEEIINDVAKETKKENESTENANISDDIF